LLYLLPQSISCALVPVEIDWIVSPKIPEMKPIIERLTYTLFIHLIFSITRRFSFIFYFF